MRNARVFSVSLGALLVGALMVRDAVAAAPSVAEPGAIHACIRVDDPSSSSRRLSTNWASAVLVHLGLALSHDARRCDDPRRTWVALAALKHDPEQVLASLDFFIDSMGDGSVAWPANIDDALRACISKDDRRRLGALLDPADFARGASASEVVAFDFDSCGADFVGIVRWRRGSLRGEVRVERAPVLQEALICDSPACR